MLLRNVPASYSDFTCGGVRRQNSYEPLQFYQQPQSYQQPQVAHQQPLRPSSVALPAISPASAGMTSPATMAMTSAAAMGMTSPAAAPAMARPAATAATYPVATAMNRPAATAVAPATARPAATAVASAMASPAATAATYPTAPAVAPAVMTSPAATAVSRPATAIAMPGPARGVYGGMLNQEPISLTLSPSPSAIPFSAMLPVSGMNFTPNTLKVDAAGAYEIGYELIVSPSLSANIRAQVLVNGKAVPTATQTLYAGIGRTVVMAHTTLAALPAGAEVTMQLSADENVEAAVSLSQLTLLRVG